MASRAGIGLDIGTTAVRVVQVAERRGRLRVTRMGEVALPPGAVREGEVVDSAAVAAAIRQLWAEVRPSSKRVGLGLASRRVVVRQVDLPSMPVDELRASLPFAVGDLIPMPTDAAMLDFWPVEERDAGGGSVVRGLLVAAAKQAVDDAVGAVQAAGLTPVSIDILPFALLRALHSGAPQDAPPAVEALVDIGADVTSMVVHSAGRPLFVRSLLRGGAAATEAIATRLAVDFATAEALKRGDLAPPDVETGEAVRALLDESAAEVALEIRNSLGYYAATAGGSSPVERVVLSGGGALLSGLLPRLVLDGMPVEVASPTHALPGDDSVPSFATAIPVGLALGCI
ncbi:type IV pilus assembly protein PilM [Motilibacter rhizosphaerae]|uniref:Type IV pilus assembly protein PilM n=1 Tax=Motilibacter rhizosphaerae TaxID=598652 RepID=A0A4Q7NR25_9ACTN|nr:type IV pilus assembly protein PilM [Motilibacter rhizosphaerae]RZS89415.1 type IV pilus assembly protein PilM [Motilibacter rhizosphaerae]